MKKPLTPVPALLAAVIGVIAAVLAASVILTKRE